jgi:hypothetical protein
MGVFHARPLRRLMIVLICLATVGGRGEIIQSTLTVTDDWTAVQEWRRFVLVAGDQYLWLDDIPDTADLSSLTVRARRLPVELLSWARAVRPSSEPVAAAAEADTSLTFAPGAPLRVQPTRPGPLRTDAVRCRIRFPVAGEHVLQVTYRMRGVSWKAHYNILLRGDLAGADERMSVDLAGLVTFRNTSHRTFENAWIRIAGADVRSQATTAEFRRPGFLSVIEGPLSDLWQVSNRAQELEMVYFLPHRITLPAASHADMPLVQATRIPATRLYVMDSDEIPLSISGVLRPLARRLVFANTEANGLGWVLPPGSVSVYAGLARRTLVREGYLPHTPLDREIRLDLGEATDVVGMRRSRTRTRTIQGFYEELFEMVVQNNRSSDIAVEIVERPASSLRWAIQRSTEDLERVRGWIEMRPRVAGNEQKRIELRLRLQEPDPLTLVH